MDTVPPQSAMPQQVVNVQQQGYAGQLLPGQQQQIILQTDQQAKGPFEMTVAKSRSFISMGATQIALGVACILFSIITTTEIGTMPEVLVYVFIMPGFWIGIFILLTGSFGVVAGKKRKSKGWIVTFMVMSIINTAVIWIIVGFASASVEECRYGYYSYCNDTDVAMNALLIICALVEFVIAIVSAAICCGALCCNTTSRGAVQYVATNPGQQQPVYLQQQPQYAPNQIQPQPYPQQQPYQQPHAYPMQAGYSGAPPGAYQAQAAPPYESLLLSEPETKQAGEQNLGYQGSSPPPEYSAGQPDSNGRF